MAECSICSRGEEAARTINALLEKQTPLREIQSETGIHKNSLHRHQHGNCRFSFQKFKAAKIKTKSGGSGGRVIVKWPGNPAPDELKNSYAYYDQPIPASELRPTDTLFLVEYARPLPAPKPQPPPEPPK